MSNQILAKIVQDHKELRALPQTLAEVLRVVRDEKSSAKDLSTVLMRDPALTSRILRIVNSPYYGGREISSVNQAVITLGTRTVTALALSTSVYNMTSDWQTGIDKMRFWRHSLEVAIAARMVAEACKYPHQEEPFVAGLLHDIGILILESSYPEKYRAIIKKAASGETLAELEDQIWGVDHARVGKFVLEQWHIPQRICEAVGRHHTQIPDHPDAPEEQLAHIISLANQLSQFRVVPKTKAEVLERLGTEHEAHAALGLTTEKVAEIAGQLFNRVVTEAKYLEINIGSPEEILLEANHLLFQQYLTVEQLLRENRQMQQQIARDQMRKAALDSVKTIAATLNHYLNNATATILGRAQLIEYNIQHGRIADPDGSLTTASQVIAGGVHTITAVMDELKNLSTWETTAYHDETHILDIERKLKAQLEKRPAAEPVEA